MSDAHTTTGPVSAPPLATWPNGVLVLLLAGSAVQLWRDDETGFLVVAACVAAVLLFFTVLTRRMLGKGKGSAVELYARTMTFWWMLASFAVAEAAPRWVGYALFTALLVLAVQEFATMRPLAPRAGDRAATGVTLVAALAAGVLGWTTRHDPVDAFATGQAVLLGAVLFVVLALVLADRSEGVTASAGWLVLGLTLCVGLLGQGLLVLDLGLGLLVWCVLLTQLRDLISFWVGKAIGGRARTADGRGVFGKLDTRIAPAVSPNKAWGAGIVAALLLIPVGIAARGILPGSIGGDDTCIWWVVGTSFAIGILGLFGDLVFSMLKRDAGVKDSGSLLPGGTGVLDRIDALVLTVPVTFQLAWWFLVRA